MTHEDHADEIRQRVAHDVITAARAAQKRVRRLGGDRFWLSREGGETNLERVSIDVLFALVDTQLLDLITTISTVRARVRTLRTGLTAEGVWQERLIHPRYGHGRGPVPMTARVPTKGHPRQYVGESRYAEVDRVSSYVFELRMGEVALDGDWSGVVVRRRLQGWPKARSAIADWLAGGTGDPRAEP